MDWLRPKGTRPNWRVLTGLALGFIGVALLAQGHQKSSQGGNVMGVIVLMIASLAWSFGSIFSRSARKPASSLLGIGMQMTAGGVLLLVLAIARGEPADFSFGQLTVASISAWLYLVMAGSLIGYTAYAWLLQVSTPARVSTYGYVNPFIAVLLGCTIGREPFSHALVMAGALIIVAVIMIVTGGSTKVNTTPCEEVA
jgi:drug/metabolite transporter (DMT)-like permease